MTHTERVAHILQMLGAANDGGDLADVVRWVRDQAPPYEPLTEPEYEAVMGALREAQDRITGSTPETPPT